MATIVSDKFHFDRETMTMSADITDLGVEELWERAYPDACDAGFRIVSARTGRSVMFVVEGEDRHDGDLIAWRLKAVKDRRHHEPILDLMKVVVYND